MLETQNCVAAYDALKLAFELIGGMICLLIAACIVQQYFINKNIKLNPPADEQQAKALAIAHELEDCIHQCGKIPLYDPQYLDPVLTMFTVGRVSRTGLHNAIFDWLRNGTDFRIEDNQFWTKK